jgi:ribosomal protein L37AE/L43A
LVLQQAEDAAMAMNRVQFQRGMSWRDVQSRYGSEAACEAELTQMRWPEGFVCPRCGEGAASLFRHWGKPLWQCPACRLQTSLVAGTMFAHSRLPLTVCFQATWLLTQSKGGAGTESFAEHVLCQRVAAKTQADAGNAGV